MVIGRLPKNFIIEFVFLNTLGKGIGSTFLRKLEEYVTTQNT